MCREYYQEAGGADIRCLVVGDQGDRRELKTPQAKPGEFAPNLHLTAPV